MRCHYRRGCGRSAVSIAFRIKRFSLYWGDATTAQIPQCPARVRSCRALGNLYPGGAGARRHAGRGGATGSHPRGLSGLQAFQANKPGLAGDGERVARPRGLAQRIRSVGGGLRSIGRSGRRQPAFRERRAGTRLAVADTANSTVVPAMSEHRLTHGRVVAPSRCRGWRVRYCGSIRRGRTGRFGQSRSVRRTPAPGLRAGPLARRRMFDARRPIAEPAFDPCRKRDERYERLDLARLGRAPALRGRRPVRPGTAIPEFGHGASGRPRQSGRHDQWPGPRHR